VEADGVDGQIFNAAGPELLSYQQQLQKFAAHIGKRCPIIPLPFLSPRLSAWWLQFVTSVPQPVAKALVGASSTTSRPMTARCAPCCPNPAQLR
jgi:uncharacterized protein YbjT (DUF2867 family)